MDAMPFVDVAQTLLIVLLLLANTLHLLVKRSGNGKQPPSLIEDGKLQEKVARLDREVEQIRRDLMPRSEADLLLRESREDRARIWSEIARLREDR